MEFTILLSLPERVPDSNPTTASRLITRRQEQLQALLEASSDINQPEEQCGDIYSQIRSDLQFVVMTNLNKSLSMDLYQPFRAFNQKTLRRGRTSIVSLIDSIIMLFWIKNGFKWNQIGRAFHKHRKFI